MDSHEKIFQAFIKSNDVAASIYNWVHSLANQFPTRQNCCRASSELMVFFEGMPKGRDKFVTINLRDVWSKFNDGDVVSLESLGEKGILNTSGRESRLPLKVPQRLTYRNDLIW